MAEAEGKRDGELILQVPGRPTDRGVAPRSLQRARGAGAPSPLLDPRVVQIEASYDLAARARGTGEASRAAVAGERLLALEAADGSVLFLRADRLRERLARLHPEAIAEDGSLDLSALRDREGAERGLGDWIWERLSVLRLAPDGILDAAREAAESLVADWLGEKLGERLAELTGFDASVAGAKALMAAIENRLAGPPGLYRWRGESPQPGDRLGAGDAALQAAAESGPLLLFIHGTASCTSGSFGDLRGAAAGGDWSALRRRFGDRIFGFEHRTFSESPIDNALQLAETLPAGARLSLVTHSRGGLVGDLLCLGDLDDALIDAYRHAPLEEETPLQARLREAVSAADQAKLRRLRELLSDKAFRIERYVRVACPAAGTRLLSDDLDLFLSTLLSLVSRLAGAFTGPLGEAALAALQRIVLEIAHKRVDARLIPGIEAMRSDAPMGPLLARAPRRQGVRMAVVAGDVEGGALLKRLLVMFTDWMFFDRFDNDLVVDTDSMYAGLARRPGAHYLFDRGESVNHFSYFANRGTRSAVRDWLLRDPAEVGAFRPLEVRHEPSPAELRGVAARGGEPPPDSRPVVILLPGIMGSHLEVRRPGQGPGEGDRVWFDFLDLVGGGLEKIRRERPHIAPETLLRLTYGDLIEYLQQDHRVILFPYDWRRPIQDGAADALAEVVEGALAEHPSQPLRLLAHSMGGLVARAMIARRPDLWRAITDRDGGRLVMLGTPNQGSHQMVATLLGLDDTVRKLARIDLRHDLQQVLEIVAGFEGALQLLPRPGFRDSGGPAPADYHDPATWAALRERNEDRWYGSGLGAVPKAEALEAARRFWCEVVGEDAQGSPRPIERPERIAYVFGQGPSTPCGLEIDDQGRPHLLATRAGDGTVSWAAGRLPFLPEERCWYMPVLHGELADSEEHFPAIAELLSQGGTARLGRLPETRGAVPPVRTLAPPPPPVYPSEEDLVRALVGGRPPQRPRPRTTLEVAVRGMDLRFAQHPVLCGHYEGDPIAGAEAQIDRYLVDGALTRRERLGTYAAEVGSAAVVLMRPGEEARARGSLRGGVIVGLGRFGSLTERDIGETVRAGVLRLLLHYQDGNLGEERALTLMSLLIGYNSTTHLTIEDSVAAVVRGVAEANRLFAETMPESGLRVGRLEFVELYEDAAISAAYAVRELPRRLGELEQRLDLQLQPAPELLPGPGMRPRLGVSAGFGYWPRLIVTAEEGGPAAPAVAADGGIAEGGSGTAAEHLRYVYLSARARAESVVQQRQPGLIENLVSQAILDSSYRPDLARTLFHLMVPLDFKPAARETERLMLVLDGYTANLPWEMLQEGDQPLVTRTAMVRQLASTRFRRQARCTSRRTACVIADPSTTGFGEAFAGDPSLELPRLEGAQAEGRQIREVLESRHYAVEWVAPGSGARDVLAALFRHPYRVLAIAAHGVHQVRDRQGRLRSGVVLSDGLLLTAAEVGQLERVPELVFLNCCHLGRMQATPWQPSVNRLAYSLARELIEMGVRCVVAAGWAVDDDAALTFSRTFFDAFVGEGEAFGPAIQKARAATHAGHPHCNTWGAYQAYGSPDYRIDPLRESVDEHAGWRPVSPLELVDAIGAEAVDARAEGGRNAAAQAQRVETWLQGAPRDWLRLATLQYALGRFYGELGPEWFERACEAYRRAIAAPDRDGLLPLRAVEQLANLEARTGEARNDVSLVESAIRRLEALVQMAPEGSERWQLLGSAWKRLAAVQLRKRRPARRSALRALKHARDAYARAQAECSGQALEPYAVLNRLMLDAVLGIEGAQRREALTLAQQCMAAARRRFARSHDFFDAIMPADARLAESLLQGEMNERRVKALIETYRSAAQGVPAASRQWNSVLAQLRLLSAFFEAAERPDLARALQRIAEALGD